MKNHYHRSVFVAIAGLALSGGGVAAQEADFLFQPPAATFGIYGGYAAASAGSGVFDLTREELTVGQRDFDSGVLGAHLGVRLDDRLELTFRGEIARSEIRSEYREYVGVDDLPIEQTTLFRRAPLVAGLKYYFGDRGRSIGRFAWIPRGVVPYVGAAGGVTLYKFQQSGEWIDFTDPSCPTDGCPIRFDTFTSDGAAPTAHLMGGVDVALGPRWFLTGEGRYAWASAEMDQGFDPALGEIDLGGFQFTVGVSARF